MSIDIRNYGFQYDDTAADNELAGDGLEESMYEREIIAEAYCASGSCQFVPCTM